MKRDTSPQAAKKQLHLDADAQRTSDVARHATEIQQQTGCTRSDALKAAEKLIPHPTLI